MVVVPPAIDLISFGQTIKTRAEWMVPGPETMGNSQAEKIAKKKQWKEMKETRKMAPTHSRMGRFATLCCTHPLKLFPLLFHNCFRVLCCFACFLRLLVLWLLFSLALVAAWFDVCNYGVIYILAFQMANPWHPSLYHSLFGVQVILQSFGKCTGRKSA